MAEAETFPIREDTVLDRGAVQGGDTPPVPSIMDVAKRLPEAPGEAIGQSGGTTQGTPVSPLVEAKGAFKAPYAERVGAGVLQEGTRERGSTLDSVYAAVQDWRATDMLRAFKSPTFTPDGIDVNAALLQVGFTLLEDEQDYLRESKSQEEFDYRLGRIQEIRERAKIQGDNLAASVITGFADPAWIPVALLSSGAGGVRLLGQASRIQRMARAAGVDATLTTAIDLVASQERPMSLEEFVTDIAMGVGASMIFTPSARTLSRRSELFPDKEARELLGKMQKEVLAPEYKWVQRLDEDGNPVMVKGKPVFTPVLAGVTKDTPAGARDISEILGEAGTLISRQEWARQTRGQIKNAENRIKEIDSELITVKDQIKELDKTPGATGRGELEDTLRILENDRLKYANERDRLSKVLKDTYSSEQYTVRRGPGQPVPPKNPLRKTTAIEAVQETLGRVKDAPSRALARNLLYQLSKLTEDIPVYWSREQYAGGSHGTLGYYYQVGHYIELGRNPDPGTVLHEVSHALTVAKIRHAERFPNSAHGRLVKELDELRRSARRKLPSDAESTLRYLTSNNYEFVAGLYTRHEGFNKFLSSLPDPKGGQGSFKSRVVDTMRRLLGLNKTESNAWLRALDISEEIMDLPVKFTWEGSTVPPRTVHMLRSSDPVVREQGLRAYGEATGDSFQKAMPTNISKKLAELGGWNFHKTLSKYSKEVADLLLDNPLSQNRNSVDSLVRSIRADSAILQRAYEDNLKDILAKQGVTTWSRIFRPVQSRRAQAELERNLRHELERRRRHFEDFGVDAPKTKDADMMRLADSWERTMSHALEEAKRSGVYGAEEIIESRGYYPRRWDSDSILDIETRLENSGLDRAAARRELRGVLQTALHKANPTWDAELAQDVATALLERARRKGNYSDVEFRGHIGNANVAEVRTILEGHMSEPRIQRVMDVLTGVQKEASKASYFKSRIDVDMNHSAVLSDGTRITVNDLIQDNLSNLMEHYLDDIAARSAFARNGIVTSKHLQDLRTKMIEGMGKQYSDVDRKIAATLFDNAVDLLHGRPVGTDFSNGVRIMQAVNQMVALGSAGLWQFTEYAKMMARFGVTQTLKGMKNSVRMNSDFRKLTPEQAGRLQNILSQNTMQDVRLRPFIEKLADNWDIPTTRPVQMALQHAKQLVPYLNGMKFIMHHQANIASNIISDQLVQAAKGNRKALRALREYGLDLEDPSLGKVRGEIQAHGTNTLGWSDEVMESVKPALNRMMDDVVLRSRKGEVPAWVQTSDIGRFLFTFRSYVLGAHNKHLMGTLNRQGVAGLSLLMMYQLPMSIVAVQANALMKGQELSDEELVTRAVGLMGSMGLLTEPWNIVMGNQREFGTPGTIGIDRMYMLAGDIVSGDFGKAVATGTNTLPLIPLIPFMGQLQNYLKEE